MQIGDKVTWTHVGGSGRIVSMTLKEGTLEGIKGDMAVVRTKSKRRVEVALRRLRPAGQPSQIDEFVRGMRDASKPPAD